MQAAFQVERGILSTFANRTANDAGFVEILNEIQLSFEDETLAIANLVDGLA